MPPSTTSQVCISVFSSNTSHITTTGVSTFTFYGTGLLAADKVRILNASLTHCYASDYIEYQVKKEKERKKKKIEKK